MNANATYNMPPFENGSFNGTTSDYIRGIQLGYFDIPPEIAAIDVQLNDLVSLPLPVVPSIELPSCAPLVSPSDRLRRCTYSPEIVVDNLRMA